MTVYIGITGTHSTGKSTRVAEIRRLAQERGISTATISDKATDCQKLGFPILRDHTFESTLWIMVTVIQQELEAGLHSQMVIVDRPVSDAIGYLEAALLRTARTISTEQREYLYALAKHHSARYALILETTLDESIPLGPGRDEDRSFRREAGVQISEALTTLKLRSLDPDSAAATARIVELLDGIDAKRMVKAD